jgi:hypothetical protein
VLDVGIGSGAQMSELLDLLAREEHRVRRLDILGLDFVEDFLEAGGRSIRAAAERLDSRLDVGYRPVKGRIETLDDGTIAQIRQDGPLDAANATIALHEVPGEAKLEALRNLHRFAPRRLVLAEWNYLLENVLPETSVEFLFNIRRVVAAMVAALRERHPLVQARAVARDWMSQAAGQLTCAAMDRQECFLDAPVWKLLLEHCGFDVIPWDPSRLAHAASRDHASVAKGGWYVATSRYTAATPIALLQACPRGSPSTLTLDG